MEIPSHSLGYAHLGLLVALLILALRQPSRVVRLATLAVALLATLALPVLWVGPAWEEPPELRRFVWGFYLSFASSLGIPFACGATAVSLLARRDPAPSLRVRLVWPLGAYLLGLLVSLPVSFNYALAYPLLR